MGYIKPLADRRHIGGVRRNSPSAATNTLRRKGIEYIAAHHSADAFQHGGGTMTLYGYIRTSKQRIDGQAGGEPDTQRRQLHSAGVQPANVYADTGGSGATGTNTRAGWHKLDGQLQQGDTLVVASIVGLCGRWLDTMDSSRNLQGRGVRIRSLAESEARWSRYLDADPDSPEAFMGDVLATFAAWVSHQERLSIQRRTVAGMDRARADGKHVGRPAGLSETQVAAVADLAAGGYQPVSACPDVRLLRIDDPRTLAARTEPGHVPGSPC